MPKRSQKYPCRVSEGEQKSLCTAKYDGYAKKPSNINPIFTRVPDYGIKKGAQA